tara:strand:- start:100 stop:453 length:354 start_codon:yes stop_codon:yes gene_type:complete
MENSKPHFSLTRRAGDLIFVSGQLAFDSNQMIVQGGISIQTNTCIDHIEKALISVDSSLEKVVKTNVWLTHPQDFEEFNTCYAKRFPINAPARSTIASALMVSDALIEIEAVAYDPI